MKQKNGHFILDFRKTVDLDFKGFFQLPEFLQNKNLSSVANKKLVKLFRQI